MPIIAHAPVNPGANLSGLDTIRLPRPQRVTDDRAHQVGIVVTILAGRIHVSAPPALSVLHAFLLADYVNKAVKLLLDERPVVTR